MPLEIKTAAPADPASAPLTDKERSEILARLVAAACADKKARDIVLLDMDGLAPSTDWFVLCSARSSTQARAIADAVEDKLAEAGINYQHKEGYHEGQWILLDYSDVVCHVFDDATREYYALENLWSKAPLYPYED